MCFANFSNVYGKLMCVAHFSNKYSKLACVVHCIRQIGMYTANWHVYGKLTCIRQIDACHSFHPYRMRRDNVICGKLNSCGKLSFNIELGSELIHFVNVYCKLTRVPNSYPMHIANWVFTANREIHWYLSFANVSHRSRYTCANVCESNFKSSSKLTSHLQIEYWANFWHLRMCLTYQEKKTCTANWRGSPIHIQYI